MTKKELRASLMDHQLSFLLHGGIIEQIAPKKIKEDRSDRGNPKRVFSNMINT